MSYWVYVINGVPIDISEPLGDTPDGAWEVYDDATHGKVYLPRNHILWDVPVQVRPRIMSDFIGRDTFLFELFTDVEYGTLDFHVSEIPNNVNFGNPTPTLEEQTYRALSIASRQLENVESVQRSSSRVTMFLMICQGLKLFTEDPATQLRRMTMIQYGCDPN
jgi:hypothetical protein